MIEDRPVRELYRAFVKQDFASLGKCLTDDVLMSVAARWFEPKPA